MADSNKDDWTYVPGKKRGHKSRLLQTSRSLDRASIDKDATVEGLTADYQARSKEWSKLALRQHVKGMLSRLHLNDRPVVDKVVCIGIGRFATMNLECKTRSLQQLVVLVDIVQHLETAYNAKLTVYLQDPMLSNVDIDFLASLRIKVVSLSDDPSSHPMLGPLAPLIDRHAFVADFFTEHQVVVHLANYEMGMLLSPLPGRAVSDPFVQQHNMQKIVSMLQNGYFSYQIPDTNETMQSLLGLYLCAPHLQDEEDDDGEQASD